MPLILCLGPAHPPVSCTARRTTRLDICIVTFPKHVLLSLQFGPCRRRAISKYVSPPNRRVGSKFDWSNSNLTMLIFSWPIAASIDVAISGGMLDTGTGPGFSLAEARSSQATTSCPPRAAAPVASGPSCPSLSCKILVTLSSSPLSAACRRASLCNNKRSSS